MRRILPDSIKNMRDIGGIITKSGMKIPYWKIVRSNLPIGISDFDKIKLLEKGLTTVIDVRTKDEILNNPSDLNNDRFNYYHVEMLGSGVPEKESEIPKGYIAILNDLRTIKRIFQIINNTQDGVIIHCNAGKDRTGVIIMLLLLLVDSYDMDIIADYQLSEIFIKDQIIQLKLKYPDLPIWIGQSKSSYMEEALRLFREKYQNINCYFEKLELASEIKTNILKNLLQ